MVVMLYYGGLWDGCFEIEFDVIGVDEKGKDG